jgi:uncharacterized membrane protein
MFHSINKYLSKKDLTDLQDKITEVEKTTSGEIKVCLKLNKKFSEKYFSSYDLAVQEFHKLGMQKTKGKSGILFYILLKEKRLEIIADEGIHKKLIQDYWDALAKHISLEFANGKYKNGVLHFLNEAGLILSREFPRKSDDTNELSDEIVIE